MMFFWNKFRRCLPFLAIFVLAGCSHRYAHTETPLNDSAYRIAYRGDPFSAPEKVQNRFFRKCAELALSGDYKYFTLTESREVAEESQSGIPESFGFKNRLEPQRIYILKMFKRKSSGERVYNAAAIYNSLASKRMLRKMSYRMHTD